MSDDNSGIDLAFNFKSNGQIWLSLLFVSMSFSPSLAIQVMVVKYNIYSVVLLALQIIDTLLRNPYMLSKFCLCDMFQAYTIEFDVKSNVIKGQFL